MFAAPRRTLSWTTLLSTLAFMACVDSSALTAPAQSTAPAARPTGTEPSLAVRTWPRAMIAEFDGVLEVASVSGEEIANVEWRFSDGTVANGSSVRHTFAKVGNTTVLIRATTVSGQLIQQRLPVSVSPGIAALGTVLTGVVPGGLHTCAIDAGAALYCWGYNGNGTIGDGTRTHRYSPALIGAGINFTQVATGFGHSCALTDTGAAYCWGKNESGQLGDGTTTDRPVPTAVLGGIAFSSIDVGYAHSCALATDGSAYCWGIDSLGQLGDGAPAPRQLQPVPVAGGLLFSLIRAGSTHTCALQQTTGYAYCWGGNGVGQVGNGTGGTAFTDRVTTPAAVSGAIAFVALDIGASHTCALVTNQTVGSKTYCWGWNDYGQLGVSTNELCVTTLKCARTPQKLPSNVKLVAITAGNTHSCGINANGEAYCWGSNTYGQLGDSTTTTRATPTLIPNVQFKSVRAGRYFTCGVLLDNTARCWGTNYYGMLGVGDNVDRTTPTAVPSLTF